MDQIVKPLPILFYSNRMYELLESKVFTDPEHPVSPLLEKIDNIIKTKEYEALNELPDGIRSLYYTIKRMNENPEEIELEKLSCIEQILLMEIALKASQKGIKKLRNDKEAVMLLSEAIPYMDEEFIKVKGEIYKATIETARKEILGKEVLKVYGTDIKKKMVRSGRNFL